MPTLEQKLADVDRRIARWQPRFTRASNEMKKLLLRRARLVREAAMDRVERVAGKPANLKDVGLRNNDTLNLTMNVTGDSPPVIERVEVVKAKPQDDLDVRDTFLARGKAAQAVAEQVGYTKPTIDARTAKRLAKNDEKRRGRSQFAPTDMPLSGKAAQAAITAAKRKPKA